MRYGFRSFNRQWIIPDVRVITQPNAALWRSRSKRQVFITAPSDRSPTAGPALTFSAEVPDLHHYNGRGGRVFPLWRDAAGSRANFPPKLLSFLEQHLHCTVKPDDLVAYIAAIAAHSGFTKKFRADLSTPGLRIPLTADAKAFAEAAALGRTVIWLQTFGERMVDPSQGRAAQPPRMPSGSMPHVSVAGAIPEKPAAMPDDIRYDESSKRLWIGVGFVENVEPTVWSYEVSGKQVLTQWFRDRRKNRARPIIGDRRPPSALEKIQPDHWLAEYTTELINLLNVVGRLVQIESQQASMLERICAGLTISDSELRQAGALHVVVASKGARTSEASLHLGETVESSKPSINRRANAATKLKMAKARLAGTRSKQKRKRVG